MNVKFFKQSEVNQDYKESFLRNASQLFDGSTYLVNGSFSTLFEKKFSEYVNASYAAFVSNGLDALILALESLNIGKGDVVVVPSHTYIATWLAPLRLGCKLIVAPVREDNLLMDMSRIHDYLSHEVKAVMPVHLYGNSCDLNLLKSLQSSYGFHIVEDAAQAHGAKDIDKMVGSLGDLTCFSFYPTKNLGAIGEAGAVTCNNKDLYEKIISLRNYGRSPENGAINQYCGLNRRGDELQACFLVEKLKAADSIRERRLKLLRIYADKLSHKRKNFTLIKYFSSSSPHLAILRLKNLEARDKLRQYLSSMGIETFIHYSVPCHAQPFIDPASILISSEIMEQAQLIADTVLSLPLTEAHTQSEIEYVCSAINDFFVD